MPIRITAPVAARSGDVHRIEAVVDGHPVWFECEGQPLAPRPEAFASAFIIPAMRVRRPLNVAGSVDALWAGHIETLGPRLRRAWHYPAQRHRYSIDIHSSGAPAAATGRTGLFFTAGVDSFHALLYSGEAIDVLINVHGFDVTLDDHERQRAVQATLRAIADAQGIRTAFLRSNLREHPLIRDTPWERTHGGALAAAAHVMGSSIDRICIASSQPKTSRNPWGSHWTIDPLWSSASLSFIHLDAEKDRRGKIHAIAGHPMARQHLRVCWSQAGARANCSSCEKCMHTMLVLEERGQLRQHPQFDGSNLLELVRTMPRAKYRHRILKALSRSPDIDPELRRAVSALYRRSVLLKSPVGSLWRALGQMRHAMAGRSAAQRPEDDPAS